MSVHLPIPARVAIFKFMEKKLCLVEANLKKIFKKESPC